MPLDRHRMSPGSATRRTVLQAGPMGLLGAMVAGTAAGQPSTPMAWAQAIAGVERLTGLTFTPAERALMRAAVETNADRYRALREVAITADTEPAFTFTPLPIASRPEGRATPLAPVALAERPEPPMPPTLDVLAFQPVTTLARLIERRELTSTELTRLYLSRLRRFGDRLRCVITLTEDLALAQAAEADREIAGGRYRGPLHGIPWGAKDLLATRGVRTTWGARPYEGQVIDHDATVVERLRAAGAVLVAKLSMGALARGGVWFGGSTRNPWDLARSSSGSSAGPGAATAAGLVGFAIGSETLGSIISPSAECGVTGLRPTYGRVSRNGAMALSWTMDKIGPMCRTVEDCVLVLNVIYGPDGRDHTVADVPFVWDADVDVSRFRVGYLAREVDQPPQDAPSALRQQWPAIGQRLQAAIDTLRGLGVTLEPVNLPEFPSDALRLILEAEAATAFDDLTRDGGLNQLTQQGQYAWPNVFRASRLIPAVEYIRAQRVRTLLARALEPIMDRYDALLSPTISQSLTVTNLTGHPALALKVGFVDGRPVALMVTGRLYDEASVLQLAHAYERATRWHLMHPTLV